ncbi:hypothetical protein BJ138DRAFT_898284 [Hygrophoropsis aurantiaca]|uniref:Uncharacterized protein n=1 Tax=Hygrophoropsis aurantiaca TaxID=72124 RepID=A0ACB7ZUS5_9AGAM|nr:hypothetical protein BJ138DRAFT_898284 [Hygrophoropsis aurantiaca]
MDTMEEEEQAPRGVLTPVISGIEGALGGYETGKCRLGGSVAGCLQALGETHDSDERRIVARLFIIVDSCHVFIASLLVYSYALLTSLSLCAPHTPRRAHVLTRILWNAYLHPLVSYITPSSHIPCPRSTHHALVLYIKPSASYHISPPATTHTHELYYILFCSPSLMLWPAHFIRLFGFILADLILSPTHLILFCVYNRKQCARQRGPGSLGCVVGKEFVQITTQLCLVHLVRARRLEDRVWYDDREGIPMGTAHW